MHRNNRLASVRNEQRLIEEGFGASPSTQRAVDVDDKHFSNNTFFGTRAKSYFVCNFWNSTVEYGVSQSSLFVML